MCRLEIVHSSSGFLATLQSHLSLRSPQFDGAVMNGEKPRTPEEAKKHLDELLDEALEETFPASDPPAVTPPDDQEPRSPEASPTVRIRP
jgi:hypothetical protein